MVIDEARRAHPYLSWFDSLCNEVIVNRLLPDAITDPWFKAWKETHAEHLSTIEAGFAPLPVLKAELAADELVGIEPLRHFGHVLYRDTDAAAVLHRGDPIRVHKRGERRVMSVELPFVDRDDLEVGRNDGELL